VTISAKIIADSQFEEYRLTTFQVRLHRFILPEITRHRMLSFSVGSNRAVPTNKIIGQVEDNPAFPVFWGKNKPGMSADEEEHAPIHDNACLIYNPPRPMCVSREQFWQAVSYRNATAARNMKDAGYHKQITNRLLEPFQWCDMIISGTEWGNFFDLRLDSAAQPEIRRVAQEMKRSLENSTPNPLQLGEWHFPYVDTEVDTELDLETRRLCSAARCARVSYLNHDKSEPDVEKDVELAKRLMDDWHWSPFEHQGTPMKVTNGYKTGLWSLKEGLDSPGYTHVDCNLDVWSANFRGFIQHRKLIDGTSGPKPVKHAWEEKCNIFSMMRGK